jgi:hypothetical protein
MERSATQSANGREREEKGKRRRTIEMLGVDVGVGVDLEGVVVDGRVLEEAVERVEHLVRQQEEELSTYNDQSSSKQVSQNHSPWTTPYTKLE